jgi:hypothetical protein
VQCLNLQFEEETRKPTTGNISPKIWRKISPIECVQSHLKTIVLREYRGHSTEYDFLKYIAEHARVLEKMVIVLQKGLSNAEMEEVIAKLTPLNSARASRDSKLLFPVHKWDGGTTWTMQAGLIEGSVFPINDPFFCMASLKGLFFSVIRSSVSEVNVCLPISASNISLEGFIRHCLVTEMCPEDLEGLLLY